MHARVVNMRLKPNTAPEFSQAIEREVLPILRRQRGFRDEITFVTPNGTEAIGISFWDNKDSAEAYERTGYTEVLRTINKLIEGPPQVNTFDVANSTVHNIAARAAA